MIKNKIKISTNSLTKGQVDDGPNDQSWLDEGEPTCGGCRWWLCGRSGVDVDAAGVAGPVAVLGEDVVVQARGTAHTVHGLAREGGVDRWA